jgi:hypothetical protein
LSEFKYFSWCFRSIYLVFVFASATFLSANAKLTKECLTDFLKFRNVQDEAFESIDNYSGDPGTCTSDVKAKINEIYGLERSKMESHIKKKPHADCAMREIEKESYENLLLTAEVIELKGVGLKFWKLSGKKSRIEELQKQAQDMADNALIMCQGQTEYGAFFDTFFEQKRTERVNDENDYCTRKHLIDKSVINPALYNFKLNPKDIRIDLINCNAIMKTELEQMKATFAGAVNACAGNTFIDNGYLEMLMKIQVLSKLTLTPGQKQTEKQTFVNSMIEMTHKIKSCSL